jgi:hypothetical protein
MPSEKRSMPFSVIAIALAACVSAAVGCTVTYNPPMDSVATYELKVMNPDGTWKWIEQQRVKTVHSYPKSLGNEEEGK